MKTPTAGPEPQRERPRDDLGHRAILRVGQETRGRNSRWPRPRFWPDRAATSRLRAAAAIRGSENLSPMTTIEASVNSRRNAISVREKTEGESQRENFSASSA